MLGIVLLVVIAGSNVRAAEPVQRLSQNGHSSWLIRDGYFSSPSSVAQTNDGYIWIGTAAGLVRFDGVRYVAWNDFPEGSTAGWRILSLFVGKDGSLWIGAGSRAGRLKDGHLTRFESLGQVSQFVEDEQGVVWFVQFGGHDAVGPICSISRDNLKCFGKPDLPFPYASAIAGDATSGIWAGSSTGLCRWFPGHPAECFLQEKLRSLAGLTGVTSILTSRNGTMWVGIGKAGRDYGLGQLAGGVWRPFSTAGLDGATLTVSALREDREGSLWVGTVDRGLYRIRGNRVEHYGTEEGLSSNTISEGGIFEDRDGTVWVATSAGLDSFRHLAVSVYSTREGLPADSVESVLPAGDGTVWFGNLSLSTLVGDELSSLNSLAQFKGRSVTSLLEDHHGRMWIGLERTLNIFSKGKLERVAAADGSDVGVVMRIAEDSKHDIWIVTATHPFRLFRIHDMVVEEKLADLGLGGPISIAPDESGGIWLGFVKGGVANFRDASLTMYPPDSVSNAPIYGLVHDKAGAFLAATPKGLLVQRGSSRLLLDKKHGLPCESLQAIVRDTSRALWMTTGCGIVEIGEDELERWLAAPEGQIRARLLDATDGVQPGRGSFTPASYAGPDGRVWFASGKVAQVVDPKSLSETKPAPTVRIEEVIADRTVLRPSDSFQLPPLTRDLEIRYTAPSFIAPQKINFKYLLEGRDDAWRDANTRREAFYTDLPPGSYTFHVKASNSDGVWSDGDTPLRFEVAPAFYQTKWFLALGLAIVAATLYGLYLFRLRQVAAKVRDQLTTKNNERERIARDLHDTLLQSIQGLILRIQAAANRVPRGDPTREALEKALEQADEVITEGRDRVHELRTAGAAFDLAQSLGSIGEELAREHAIAFLLTVEGEPREVQVAVKDETYNIGREALLNAFRHANPKSVEVQIIYSDDDFRLRVRDDGRGIEASALEAEGRPGHWGLKGMRERAQKMGASLGLWSRANAGTEVELKVPATAAYARQIARFHWLSAMHVARK